MKSFATFGALLFAIVSCNANPPIGPDPIDASTSATSSSSSSTGSSSGGGSQGDGSGGRLRRYMYTDSQGLRAEAPTKFYDSLMGVDCEPALTSAGLLCVPNKLTIAIDPWFVDDTCTTPAADIQTTCPAPLYAYSAIGMSCAAPSVRRLYTITPVASPKLYQQNGGCVEVPVGPSVAIYAVGPEVDYAQFAPLTLEHE